jgi:hypothetical protein
MRPMRHTASAITHVPTNMRTMMKPAVLMLKLRNLSTIGPVSPSQFLRQQTDELDRADEQRDHD